jgi:hypothetical protein
VETAIVLKRQQSLIPPVVGVAVVLVIFYLGALALYSAETSNRRSVFDTDATQEPNRVDATAQIVGLDPIKGELTVRLDMQPVGDLVNADGRTLARDLKLVTNAATGPAERALPKGKIIAATDIVVSMYDGEVTDYPFDRQSTNLDLSLTGTDADSTPIPLNLSFNGAWHGFAIDAVPDPATGPGQVYIDMSLARSGTTIAVAIFIMVLQLGLALALLVLLFSLIRGARKVELGMFSWMGAMLFAFPALRNASPGIPPIVGTLSDFLAFFWAESIVAIVLVVSVGLWLFRPQK